MSVDDSDGMGDRVRVGAILFLSWRRRLGSSYHHSQGPFIGSKEGTLKLHARKTATVMNGSYQTKSSAIPPVFSVDRGSVLEACTKPIELMKQLGACCRHERVLFLASLPGFAAVPWSVVGVGPGAIGLIVAPVSIR